MRVKFKMKLHMRTCVGSPEKTHVTKKYQTFCPHSYSAKITNYVNFLMCNVFKGLTKNL